MNLPSWVHLTAAWYSDRAQASRAFISSLILKLFTCSVRYSTYSITLVTTRPQVFPHRHACILPVRSEHRNADARFLVMSEIFSRSKLRRPGIQMPFPHGWARKLQARGLANARRFRGVLGVWRDPPLGGSHSGVRL